MEIIQLIRRYLLNIKITHCWWKNIYTFFCATWDITHIEWFIFYAHEIGSGISAHIFISCSAISPSWHLFVQSQRWKHQNSVWNLSKVNMELWTDFRYFSGASTFDFEQANGFTTLQISNKHSLPATFDYTIFNCNLSIRSFYHLNEILNVKIRHFLKTGISNNHILLWNQQSW